MKKAFLYFFVVTLFGAACSKIEGETTPFLSETKTRALLGLETSISLDTTYYVSEADIDAYIKYKGILEKREINNPQISSISDEKGNVLLYIINYQDGWDLLAADKRATLPLSSSPIGSLKMDEDGNPVYTWIASLAEDVLVTRMTDSIEAENPEVIEFNLKQWNAITADETLFASILNECFPKEQTRDPIPPLVPYPGHYELISVTSEDLFYDSVNHHINCEWSQSLHQCNAYVPYMTNSTTDRVPAGCVAVAGAQMLYYLHSKIGYPIAAPTTAYCIGEVGNYSMGQSDFSSTAWEMMTHNGDTTAAKLIACVALLANTTFGNNGSGASTEDLSDDCFPAFGISSVFTDYDASVVKMSLLNEMPVIVSADGTSSWFNFHDGHAFIIDGYKRIQMKYTYEYMWVWDYYDPNLSYPKIPTETEIAYSSPMITHFKMNWGWGPSEWMFIDGDWRYYLSYNDVFFACSGDWIVNINETDYNFIYRRKMIYNFEGPES